MRVCPKCDIMYVCKDRYIIYYIHIIIYGYMIVCMYTHTVVYYSSINTQSSVVRLDKWTILGWMSLARTCQDLIPFHSLLSFSILFPRLRLSFFIIFLWIQSCVPPPLVPSTAKILSHNFWGKTNHCPNCQMALFLLRHPLCSDAPKYHMLVFPPIIHITI